MNPESRFIREIPGDLLENLNEKKTPRMQPGRKVQPKRVRIPSVSYANKTGGDSLSWAVGDKA